jgi:hypothetical protein
MSKLGQLAGLTAIDTYRLNSFQANYLAAAVGETLMKTALENPAAISGPMATAVRARTTRMARAFREQNESADAALMGGTPLGPPPEQ